MEGGVIVLETDKTLLELELEAILTTSKNNIVITDGKGIVLKVSPNCLDIYLSLIHI